MLLAATRQAADEIKQMLTYRKDYFTSPWNYMDVASCLILAILFLLHITRLSNQVGGGGGERAEGSGTIACTIATTPFLNLVLCVTEGCGRRVLPFRACKPTQPWQVVSGTLMPVQDAAPWMLQAL